MAASILSGLKIVFLMIGFGLAFCMLVMGPSSLMSWSLMKMSTSSSSSSSSSSVTCPLCTCDCLLTDSESTLLPGVVNTPSLECQKVDPALKEDIDKTSSELLSEELKLQESVFNESQRHAESALLDAKKLSSQYQKEAEKCNAGMETCEEAREKSEMALAAQKEVSMMWETRARDLGWRDKGEHQSIFSRIGLTTDDGDGVQSNSFFKARK